MFSGAPNFIICFMSLLSLAKQYANSDLPLPLPSAARVYSGNSGFRVNNDRRRKPLSIGAYDSKKRLNTAMKNLSSSQESPYFGAYYGNNESITVPVKKTGNYRKREDFVNKLRGAATFFDISSLSEATFSTFSGDNFGEDYRHINRTYFSEGIGTQEKDPYDPYTQVRTTTATLSKALSSSTTTTTGATTTEQSSSLSPLSSLTSLSSPPLSSKSLLSQSSLFSSDTNGNTSAVETSDILDDLDEEHPFVATSSTFEVSSGNFSTDGGGTIENPGASDAVSGSSEVLEHPKATTMTALTPNYWEMQRTDSGDSIIKVTVTPTPLWTSSADESSWSSSVEEKSTSSEIETLHVISTIQRTDSSFVPETVITTETVTQKPSHSSVSDVQTTDDRLSSSVSDYDLTTTASANTIFASSPDLFSTLPEPDEDMEQNQKTGIALAAPTDTTFDERHVSVEPTSFSLSKLMRTTGTENLIMSSEESTTTALDDKFPEPLEFELSTFSRFQIPTSNTASPLSPPSPTATGAFITTMVPKPPTTEVPSGDYDDHFVEFPPIDNVFISDDGANKIGQPVPEEEANDRNSTGANSRKFFREYTNPDTLSGQNVVYGAFGRTQSADGASLVYDPNKPVQQSAGLPIAGSPSAHSSRREPESAVYELSSILGNQVDDTVNELIRYEEQQMGISIPKSGNEAPGVVLVQVPRQRGVSTATKKALSNNNTFSFKRGIIHGKILEEQELLIAGKPVTLRLWNPLAYGHDWLSKPGAIIHGKLRPLHAEAFNIKTRGEGGRSNTRRHNRARISGVRSSMSDTRKSGTLTAAQIAAMDDDMQRLAEASCGYSKDTGPTTEITGGGDDQDRNILVMLTEVAKDSVGNGLQGAGKGQQQQKCFYVKKNCFLVAGAPFERRIGMNLMECAQFCTSLLGCLSASYSSRLSTCDAHHSKYSPRNTKLLRLSSQYYLEPQTDSAPGCSTNSSFVTVMKMGKSLLSERHSTVSEPQFMPNKDAMESRFHRYAMAAKSYGKEACSDGERSVVMESPGWRLGKSRGRKRDFLATEIECLQHCFENKYKDAQPYHCDSAIFDKNSNLCSLYPKTFPADALIPDPSFNYYAKKCWLEQIAELCDGALLEQQPQRVLLGYSNAILTTSTLVECVLRCFWSRQDGQTFQCRSLMYFYEQEVDNCVLNSGSKKDRPDGLTEEMVSIVDYFGLDKCLNMSLLDQEIRSSKTNPSRTRRHKKHQTNDFPLAHGSSFHRQ